MQALPNQPEPVPSSDTSKPLKQDNTYPQNMPLADIVQEALSYLDTSERQSMIGDAFLGELSTRVDIAENIEIRREIEPFLQSCLDSIVESRRASLNDKIQASIASILATKEPAKIKLQKIKDEAWNIFANQVRTGQMDKFNASQVDLIRLAIEGNAYGYPADLKAFLQEGVEEKQEVFLEVCRGNPELLRGVPKSFWDDEKFVKEAMKINLPIAIMKSFFLEGPKYQSIDDIPPWKLAIYNDRETMLEACIQHPECYFVVDYNPPSASRLRDDEAFHLELAQRCPKIVSTWFVFCPNFVKKFGKNLPFLRQVAKYDARVILYLKESMRHDKQLLVEFARFDARQHGEYVKYLGTSILENRESMSWLVEIDLNLLDYSPLRADADFMVKVCKGNPLALEKADPAIREEVENRLQNPTFKDRYKDFSKQFNDFMRNLKGEG